MKYLRRGGFCQIGADQQDQSRDHEAGYIFVAGVAVGMISVRRLLRHAEPQQRHQRRGSVRQIVDGVGDDRDRAGKQTGDKFSQEQQEIAYDSRHSRQLSDGGVNGGLIRRCDNP